VREAAFGLLGEELPYAVATEIDEFRETSAPVYIRINILVERPSQRGIVIGKDGRMLRAIGTAARQRIEALLGHAVYLDLWVKVLPKWRSRTQSLRRLGFPISPKETP
jgi:GTP-binding protein Era